jgi:hypothetical protein
MKIGNVLRQNTGFYKVAVVVFLLAAFSSCKKDKKSDGQAATPTPTLSAIKAIKTFGFKADKNPQLINDVVGQIKGDTIYATAVAGTDLTGLVPEFTFDGDEVVINSSPQKSETNARDFSKPLTYTVVAADNSKKDYVVKFLDNGVPALYISTAGGAAVTSKDVYVSAILRTVSNFTDSSVMYKLDMKGHGNSTWSDMPKKPYRLKLSKKVSLFGLPETKNWILLANYADKSLMRNEMAFTVSRDLSRAFTPASKFIELYLNNVYLGNYQITQMVKEGTGLVDIEEQTNTSTTLPDLSGGYLIEQDLFPGGVYFRTTKNMPFVVKYPDDDIINQQQKDYIKAHFQKAEDAMFAANFADPVNGYRKYFDVDTYVDYYIVNEVIGNPDVFRSTYLFKKRNDDKIYTGPIWDFDKAADNDNRLGEQVNGLMYTSAFEPKIWIKQLMLDRTFRQRIRNRWNEVKPKIMALPNTIDPLAAKLAYSQARNFVKWDILKKQSYLELKVNGSYAGEVQYLKDFLTNHIAWLDIKFNSADYQ